jgi:nucleoside-diphosphate-sugar epimerase
MSSSDGNGHGGKLVCVTGGSGYIASWLVKFLLQRGYTVRATVRHPNDPKKTEHLRALDGAKERLHLLKAELLEEGAFDSVIDGCDAVFHTASPVAFIVTNPQPDLIDPAVNGTLNVLRSCAKTSSVKRVVVTSSMAAVSFNGRPLAPDVVVDETWFSDPSFCKESKKWYVLSKTLAEEAAWQFAKENGIDLVTLNPSLVIGPMLQPTLNLTVEMFFNILNGAETFPNEHYRYVDVRDVAYAHILAFEVPSANGRYILSGTVMHASYVVKMLREHYPTLKLPDKCSDKIGLFPTAYQVTKEKAKGLGVKFTPFEVTLKDTVESLKEKGFLNV